MYAPVLGDVPFGAANYRLFEVCQVLFTLHIYRYSAPKHPIVELIVHVKKNNRVASLTVWSAS